jgi:hypothetical protein
VADDAQDSSRSYLVGQEARPANDVSVSDIRSLSHDLILFTFEYQSYYRTSSSVYSSIAINHGKHIYSRLSVSS